MKNFATVFKYVTINKILSYLFLLATLPSLATSDSMLGFTNELASLPPPELDPVDCKDDSSGGDLASYCVSILTDTSSNNEHTKVTTNPEHRRYVGTSLTNNTSGVITCHLGINLYLSYYGIPFAEDGCLLSGSGGYQVYSESIQENNVVLKPQEQIVEWSQSSFLNTLIENEDADYRALYCTSPLPSVTSINCSQGCPSDHILVNGTCMKGCWTNIYHTPMVHGSTHNETLYSNHGTGTCSMQTVTSICRDANLGGYAEKLMQNDTKNGYWSSSENKCKEGCYINQNGSTLILDVNQDGPPITLPPTTGANFNDPCTEVEQKWTCPSTGNPALSRETRSAGYTSANLNSCNTYRGCTGPNSDHGRLGYYQSTANPCYCGRSTVYHHYQCLQGTWSRTSRSICLGPESGAVPLIRFAGVEDIGISCQ